MGCNPSDTTNCYLVNFKFNNSIVSTSGGKYQITNTSFPVILRVLNVGPSDAGTYQCKFKCSGVDVSSSAVYLPFACKSMEQPHWDSHALAFVYTVPLPQSPLGQVQSSHCVVSCTCTCAYNIPLTISRLITYLWMYKCVLLYFKLTHVSYSFTIDPVSFSTPNNVVYHEYAGHDVTLICNVINYAELQWQLTDNTVISSNSKYQYQVRHKVIKDCPIFILPSIST